MSRSPHESRVHVLVVEDDPGVRFTLCELLLDEGFTVTEASNGQEAISSITDETDLILSDLMMPGMDGMALLEALTQRGEELPLILLTAHGSERVAVEAMKRGAWDYLKKPFDVDEVVAAVRRAATAQQLKRRAREAATRAALGGEQLIAQSASMRRLVRAVERVAPRDVTVLIRGETGSGKEVIGSLLHAHGERARGPLVRFNCAAIPEALAESELFGHEAGAFTGATRRRQGYVQQAQGGTLILDEVGELPLSTQSKLLRLLSNQEVQRVGAARPEQVDVRIVACTHRNLAAEVEAGRFRADLYYRLAVVELEVPPLRERREEIPALIAHFMAKYAARFDMEPLHIDEALVARWSAQPWPGNVRELENAVARAIAMSDGVHLVDEPSASATPSGAPAPPRARGAGQSYHEQMARFERELLREALQRHDGNQSQAARELGLARTTLIDKLKRHEIYER